MFKSFLAFFARVSGTTANLLVPEELYRSIVTALGSGGVVGLAVMILTAIQANAAAIFPSPLVAYLATTALTLVLDLLRRQNHGPTPVPPAS